jgi:hypothetical protein
MIKVKELDGMIEVNEVNIALDSMKPMKFTLIIHGLIHNGFVELPRFIQ